MPILKYWLLVGGLVLSTVCRGESFCFAMAESYYEQVYCELVARGAGRDLPPMYEFRNNPPMTQALLLIRPARRLGLDITLPEKSSVSRTAVVETIEQPEANDTGLSDCTVEQGKIRCSGQHYRLVGNQPNRFLREGALAPDNRLGLAPFRAGLDDSNAVSDYLSRSYRRYLSKMRDIGLAGSTMTFAKFAYLFADTTAKGVSFAERAETMFTYLKKDKQQMAVSTESPQPSLSAANCRRVNAETLVCAARGRNYLYEAQ